MAVPLSATFILDDKYSKALMEIVKNTQKADQATEQVKDTIQGIGDEAQRMEPKVINPLDKIGKKMMGFVSIGYAVKRAFDLMWSGSKVERCKVRRAIQSKPWLAMISWVLDFISMSVIMPKAVL